MGATMHFSGPKPGTPGDYFCAICAMIFKGTATNHTDRGKEFLRAAAVEDESKQMHMTLVSDAPQPKLAITVSLSTIRPDLGPLPVCWTHMMGMDISLKSGITPAGPLPPGFGNGVPRIGRG